MNACAHPPPWCSYPSASSLERRRRASEDQEEGEEIDDELDNDVDDLDDDARRFSDADMEFDSADEWDEQEEDHPGARWAWPFTSGDHVPHLTGFAKSLLYELARTELPPVANSAPPVIANATVAQADERAREKELEMGTAYRSAEGVNTSY
jgi:hypothetical protein